MYFGIFALSLFLFLTSMKADAAGWTGVDDGWAAIDSNGCLVHIHTEEWKLFGITWSTRTVVDEVWCPN